MRKLMGVNNNVTFHFCMKQTTSVGANGNLCRVLSFNTFLAVMTIYLFPISYF